METNLIIGICLLAISAVGSVVLLVKGAREKRRVKLFNEAAVVSSKNDPNSKDLLN